MANYQLGFVDIETVSQCRDFEEVPIRQDELFTKKFKYELEEMENPDWNELYLQKAALYAEFGKVVCIVIGRIDEDKNLRLKTLCGRFEQTLLAEAAKILSMFNYLVGHNSKDFDFPFLSRRMMIHGIQIPNVINTAGKKPWEMQTEDTMEMWACGQWKYKTSLDLIAYSFGLPSPKQEISGEDVGRIYWEMFDQMKGDELPFEAEEKAVKTIGTYCQGDVVTLARIYQKMKNLEPFKEIIYS